MVVDGWCLGGWVVVGGGSCWLVCWLVVGAWWLVVVDGVACWLVGWLVDVWLVVGA